FAELPTQREYPGRDTMSLFAEVSRAAIRDAGLRKEDIDGLFTQETLSSLEVSEVLGIQPHYTLSITAHGATGATSIGTAAAVVNAGLANYVLCVFGMSRPPSSSRLEAQRRAQAAPLPSMSTEFEVPFGPV